MTIKKNTKLTKKFQSRGLKKKKGAHSRKKVLEPKKNGNPQEKTDKRGRF